MKKNAMLKIAAILMVAVLLTTCAISSTFAKYVTKADGADSARVAKWGVTAVVNTAGAFEKTYGDKVQIGTTDNNIDLVAPGTSKANAAIVTITGKPEVATDITVGSGTADGYVVLSGWEINYGGSNIYYCPLVITVKTLVDGQTVTDTFDGNTYENLTKFMEAVNGKISGYLETNNGVAIAANTDLAKELKIDWAWAYQVSDNPSTTNIDEKAVADAKDTLLGNNATANTIAFNFDISIEQAGPAVTPAP